MFKFVLLKSASSIHSTVTSVLILKLEFQNSTLPCDCDVSVDEDLSLVLKVLTYMYAVCIEKSIIEIVGTPLETIMFKVYRTGKFDALLVYSKIYGIMRCVNLDQDRKTQYSIAFNDTSNCIISLCDFCILLYSIVLFYQVLLTCQQKNLAAPSKLIRCPLRS